jgi:adenylate cyclase
LGHNEIERKFLVVNDAYREASFKKERIVQGFLSSVPERTVRIRIIGHSGFITVKGIGNTTGTTRFEWEKEISLSDAERLLSICEPGKIDKLRYFVKAGEHVYEIDDFTGENQGLVVAEIELQEENEGFEKPDWLGEEVTGQVQYYNSYLAKNPFKNW